MIARESCTGCGSCAAACPKDCITMSPDAEGFLYPVLDEAKCIECGKCKIVCPILRPPAMWKETAFIAAQNKDLLIRQTSSSGGVFSSLASWVVDKGGVVCAAAHDPDFRVCHKIEERIDLVGQFRGAKYSQSYAGHLFAQLREILEGGERVLFVGTPCQCAGLDAFLGRKYDGLLLVDMVCHGVPSPVVWGSYIERRSFLDASSAEIVSIDLRNKSTGWSRYSYCVEYHYQNGAVYSVPQSQDAFMRGFTENLYLRPSCSACSFKGIHRCTDLTLGDCWGIWEFHPEFDDNKGTSLLLIHSPKGQAVWNEIAVSFQVLELDGDEAVRHNPSALVSSAPHPSRTVFFERLSKGEPVDIVICDCLTVDPIKKDGVIKRLLRKICH